MKTKKRKTQLDKLISMFSGILVFLFIWLFMYFAVMGFTLGLFSFLIILIQQGISPIYNGINILELLVKLPCYLTWVIFWVMTFIFICIMIKKQKQKQRLKCQH